MINIPARKIRTWAAVIVLPVAIGLQSNVLYAACETDVLETSPTSAFTDNSDGTVTDNRTGLMWSVCSEGQTWSGGSCSGSHTTHSWDSALAVATTQNTANYLTHSDWRLPNKNELTSILELACVNPAINETVFPNAVNTTYWTSTPDFEGVGSPNAWRVVFDFGNVTLSTRTAAFAVRLVRN